MRLLAPAGEFDFDAVVLAGLDAHRVSVRACGLGTAEVDVDPAGVTAAISADVGVPAVDGVHAPGPADPRRHWLLATALGLES